MDELNLQDETRKIGFPDEQFTGCHFTREGNESIAEHMRNVIERVLKMRIEKLLQIPKNKRKMGRND